MRWLFLSSFLGCKSPSREPVKLTGFAVAPAPAPASLPLVGESTRDADGYPMRHVDQPAMRSLLLQRKYEALNDYFEQLQTEFESDPRNEYWPIDAADAFRSQEPALRAPLDEWVAATPKTFAPYLARGSYLLA